MSAFNNEELISWQTLHIVFCEPHIDPNNRMNVCDGLKMQNHFLLFFLAGSIWKTMNTIGQAHFLTLLVSFSSPPSYNVRLILFQIPAEKNFLMPKF